MVLSMQAFDVQGRDVRGSRRCLYSLLVMGSMKSSGSSFCVGSSGPSTPPPSAAAHSHRHIQHVLTSISANDGHMPTSTQNSVPTASTLRVFPMSTI